MFSHSIRCSSKGDYSFSCVYWRNNCSQTIPRRSTALPVRGDILTVPSDLPFNSWLGVSLLISVKTKWFRKKPSYWNCLCNSIPLTFFFCLFLPSSSNRKYECSFPSLWFHADSSKRLFFLYNFRRFSIFIGYTVLGHMASPFTLILKESVAG